MNSIVKIPKSTKVFVGLSGGVDSAVTAALLQKEGMDVTGVFIKGWYPPDLPCTWAEDRRDAMRVAARLSIPFITFDASDAYKKSVIDYLVSEYAQGRTPNPDIMCNRDVKFGAFYQFAKDQGAKYVATGHYAIAEGGRLYRGIDVGKDQSYFLWAVPHTVLTHSLFPLGNMKKSEVRNLAQQLNLPVATKKDSQGICFLGPVSIDEFLHSEFEVSPGTAVDREGRVIGKHEGAVLYTLGERVSLTEAAQGPWFVVAKDIAKNQITVAKEVAIVSEKKKIPLQSINVIRAIESDQVEAQYRYHGPIITGVITKDAFIPAHNLPEPLAAGQSLVWYQNNECVGGGIIGE